MLQNYFVMKVSTSSRFVVVGYWSPHKFNMISNGCIRRLTCFHKYWPDFCKSMCCRALQLYSHYISHIGITLYSYTVNQWATRPVYEGRDMCCLICMTHKWWWALQHCHQAGARINRCGTEIMFLDSSTVTREMGTFYVAVSHYFSLVICSIEIQAHVLFSGPISTP